MTANTQTGTRPPESTGAVRTIYQDFVLANWSFSQWFLSFADPKIVRAGGGSEP